MKEIKKNIPEIRVGGYNVNNIWYAYNTVLVAKYDKGLQKLLVIEVRESEKKGIALNSK